MPLSAAILTKSADTFQLHLALSHTAICVKQRK
jgi:hypothetical protein